MASRNAALTREAFKLRWAQHSALTGTTQRIRPYFTQVVQCARAELAGFSIAATDFDGANLLSLKDRGGGYGVFEEPEARDIMLPDELETFSRPVRECTLVTREEVVRDGPFKRFLILRFLKRTDDQSFEQFAGNWKNILRQLDVEGEGKSLVRRSVVDVVVEPTPKDFDFDLVTETWFANEADITHYCSETQCGSVLASERKRTCVDSATISFAAIVNHARPPIED